MTLTPARSSSADMRLVASSPSTPGIRMPVSTTSHAPGGRDPGQAAAQQGGLPDPAVEGALHHQQNLRADCRPWFGGTLPQATTRWLRVCASVRLRRPRTDPSAAAAAIAGTAGSDAPVTAPSHGRWSRTSQQENPSHAAVLRPAWHADQAAGVCPGHGLDHVDHWPWVRSGVVTADLDDTCLPGWYRVRKARKSKSGSGLCTRGHAAVA
jgi:hypothetical protein